MSFDRRISVYLVQQGIWNMPLESMPLAAGYMKATALADERIREAVDIKIFNYRGGVTLAKMANDIFTDAPPDVLACSVLGWNYRTFGALAETFKQINPDGWVIFGGTHVANQGVRTFSMFPEVDVVVNGEGELTFRDLLNSATSGPTAVTTASFRGWVCSPTTRYRSSCIVPTRSRVPSHSSPA